MKQKVVLINPPLISCKSDFSGSGIPYMPMILASVNAIIRDKHDVSVFDMFGNAPNKMAVSGCNLIQGVEIESVALVGGTDVVAVVFAGVALALESIVKIVSILKSVSTKRVIVVENAQNVSAVPLDIYASKLFKAGADCIICGDPEGVIMDAIAGKLPKIGRYFVDGNDLPIPDWSGFPLDNYWNVPYAHAPRKNRKYMQILTSRGCPGMCNFCTSPKLNDSRWRPRCAESVFDEIVYWYSRGINEFFFEDLNPTVDKKRIKDLCQMIIDKQMWLSIKVASGTKIETVDEETLLWMHDAGFTYLSFSPESGSACVLDFMNKKFDHEYALKMLRFMNGDRFINPIFTQACFIAGYPDETNLDWRLTEAYAKKLAKEGLDEIAIFGFIPMPGSASSGSMPVPTRKITFGSGWRMSRYEVETKRIFLAIAFYVWQAFYHPKKLLRFGRSKVWMTLKRVLYSRYRALGAKTRNIHKSPAGS